MAAARDTTFRSRKDLRNHRTILLQASAEFERERIRERVLAGLQRARVQGRRLGRPRARPPIDGLQRVAGPPVHVAAERLGVSRVEPVIGQIKQARGFRQFLLRGFEKVQGEVVSPLRLTASGTRASRSGMAPTPVRPSPTAATDVVSAQHAAT